jgi:hypothetical protein
MRRLPTQTFWLFCLLILLLLLSALTLTAAPRSDGGVYSLNWMAVTGGGSTASGGSYDLKAASGEAAAAHSSGGNYQLVSGFMAGVAPRDYTLYLPVVAAP